VTEYISIEKVGNIPAKEDIFTYMRFADIKKNRTITYSPQMTTSELYSPEMTTLSYEAR